LIDIHTHILPGVDDGVPSLDEAIEILRRATAAGVKRIVLTPHVLEFPSDKESCEINRIYQSLSLEIEKKQIDITIHLGAELYITPELPRIIKEYPAVTIDQRNKYALVELPAHEIPPFTMETIYQLMVKGIVPILAHPERNLAIQESPERLSELISRGALTQLNAESLTGTYGKRAQKTAKLLLAHDLIHLMGSDIHTLKDGPYPLLKGVHLASRIVGEKRAHAMVDSLSEKIIRGEPLCFPKPKPIKKTLFRGILS